MLTAQYSYAIGGRQQLKAVIRGEWKYLGTTYYDLGNTISQSPYHLLNLRAGVAAKNFEIMFWDRNATDTRYFAYAYDFGAVRLGDPETYGITLMVDSKCFFNHGGKAEVARRSTEELPPWTSVLPRLFLRG